MKHPLQMFLVKVLVNNDPTLLAGQEVGVDRVFLGDQLKYCCIVVSSLPILCVYPFSRNILPRE
jgi:putative aldouronate transport system permease protein